MIGERRPPATARIRGRGSLIRTLQALIGRVERYGRYRAGTIDEQRWAGILFDRLTAALSEALTSDGARASLRAVEERRRISRKTPTPVQTGASQTGGLL